MNGVATLATNHKETLGISSESLIGVGTIVDGNVMVSGSLRVDGQVKGNVSNQEGQASTLVVGEKGRVAGNVSVARLIVQGLVTGRVYARKFLSLQSKAHVTCDVEYGDVEICSGAIVQGWLSRRQLASKDDQPRIETA